MKNKLRENLLDLIIEAKKADTEDTAFSEFLADFLIANGVTIQEWIPVSEPPKVWRRKNGEMVNYLIYVPEFGVDIGNYGAPAKCWLCMGLPCKPTHWAHLPQPPKGECTDES